MVETVRKRGGTTAPLVPRGQRESYAKRSRERRAGGNAGTRDGSPRREVVPPAEARGRISDYDLRFVIVTHTSGRAELRYFASPHDIDGVTMKLSSRERRELSAALDMPGFAAIARDDAPDLQGRLDL